MDVDDDGHLQSVFASLEPHARSIALLEGRANDDDGWPYESTWVSYLCSLPEAVLARCECYGLHCLPEAELQQTPMPESLRQLCVSVSSASIALGRRAVGMGGGSCSSCCSWRQSLEKAEQVDTLLGAFAARLRGGASGVRRVVDVGCGKGHLTFKLQRALGVPALGLDIDRALIETARKLYPTVAFEARDLVHEGLAWHAGDLIVGLHPCGALGEAMITATLRPRADDSPSASVSAPGYENADGGATDRASSVPAPRPTSSVPAPKPMLSTSSSAMAAASPNGPLLLMVPCCWHKQHMAVREPLSRGARAAGLRLPVKALKKASMALDSSTSLAGRRARSELRELLRHRGVDETELSSRSEMDGIHPRKAARGIAVLAAEALRLRAMPPATDAELAQATATARGPFERHRRLGLLEPVLGELVELLCTLDRALALQEAGMRTCIFRAFEAGASDRNLAVLAQPPWAAASNMAAPLAAYATLPPILPRLLPCAESLPPPPPPRLPKPQGPWLRGGSGRIARRLCTEGAPFDHTRHSGELQSEKCLSANVDE